MNWKSENDNYNHRYVDLRYATQNRENKEIASLKKEKERLQESVKYWVKKYDELKYEADLRLRIQQDKIEKEQAMLARVEGEFESKGIKEILKDDSKIEEDQDLYWETVALVLEKKLEQKEQEEYFFNTLVEVYQRLTPQDNCQYLERMKRAIDILGENLDSYTQDKSTGVEEIRYLQEQIVACYLKAHFYCRNSAPEGAMFEEQIFTKICSGLIKFPETSLKNEKGIEFLARVVVEHAYQEREIDDLKKQLQEEALELQKEPRVISSDYLVKTEEKKKEKEKQKEKEVLPKGYFDAEKEIKRLQEQVKQLAQYNTKLQEENRQLQLREAKNFFPRASAELKQASAMADEQDPELKAPGSVHRKK